MILSTGNVGKDLNLDEFISWFTFHMNNNPIGLPFMPTIFQILNYLICYTVRRLIIDGGTIKPRGFLFTYLGIFCNIHVNCNLSNTYINCVIIISS